MNEVKYVIMINYDCQISKDKLNSIEEDLYDKGFDQKLAQGSYLFNGDVVRAVIAFQEIFDKYRESIASADILRVTDITRFK